MCNYELCVKVVNKSNIHFKTPSVVTPYYVTILHGVLFNPDDGDMFLRNAG
jgi:hypothetical protein